MKLMVDLLAEDLGPALASLLPKRIVPREFRLDDEGLRLEAEAPLLGKVVLRARVERRPGSLTLSGFDLEGAGLAKAFVLGRLRDALRDLDHKAGPFRLWGEPDGERLRVEWG